MTSYDSASFAAGQDTGARMSACLARLAALQLVEESHWWNRRRRRLMARALVSCAEELESVADASWPFGAVEPRDEPEPVFPQGVGDPGEMGRATRAP